MLVKSGAKNIFNASQPIAPANWLCKNWVIEQICLASTVALLAGFELEGIVGMFFIPFFLMYSGE